MFVDSGTNGTYHRNGSAPTDRPTGSPLVKLTGGWYPRCKFALDFILALLLLILAAPVIVVAVVLVKLSSHGPAFYSQTRLGRKGRPYTIHKIRTMVHNCEQATGPLWATPFDPRITPIGRVLRQSHIDELPQLWNVLRGEMSLVGPRPERPEFLPLLEQAIPHYQERLLARPGMTGLAQVQLPPDTDLASVRRKLAYDLYYIDRLSFWLDIQILLGTGCYLLRVPFALQRKLFGTPCGKQVEDAYPLSPAKYMPGFRSQGSGVGNQRSGQERFLLSPDSRRSGS